MERILGRDIAVAGLEDGGAPGGLLHQQASGDLAVKSCGAEKALSFLAGKWRPMIIFWLMQGTRRFNQLQRDLGGVTHRTLSKTLKEMEADGLVLRHDYAQIPPRVDYALTDKGRSLAPVLEAMHAWADAHLAE